MKIFDCFSYWDEDLLLELRLNILEKHVDFFVIVEALILRFWGVRIMFFCNFGGPGTHFRDYCDFGSVLTAKNQSILEVILQAATHFLVLRFFMFFSMLPFLDFLRFQVPGGSILSTFLPHFQEPWDFEKTAKTVILS